MIRTAPLKRTEFKAKPRKARDGDDPAYLKAVRNLPCVICDEWEMTQLSRTEAHHAICGRHSQNKTPDSMAIPLCNGHHEGDRDNSKVAIHRERAEWVRLYGDDREYIARTQDAVAGQINEF